MPRKPRRKRNRRSGLSRLSPGQLAFLKDDPSGCSGFERGWVYWCLSNGLPTMDWDPEPQELWREYRDVFLPEFIEKNPGRRPVAWWLYDSPQDPRRAIGENGDRQALESETAYLDRHGLLTDAERRALEKQPAAWDPEVIESSENKDQARVSK